MSFAEYIISGQYIRLFGTVTMGRHATHKKIHKFCQVRTEDILSVYKYFIRENQKLKQSKCSVGNIIKKTAEALNVSSSGVRQVLKNKNECRQQSVVVTSRSRTKIDSFDRQVIRRKINQFYLEKRLPTIPKLLAALKPDITLSATTLRKILIELGYCYRRTTDNRRVIAERMDMVVARAKFLRDITSYRQQGYQAVYIDETWVNQNHCKSYGWLPVLKSIGIEVSLRREDIQLPNIPSGKGRRLIILHAGCKDGFIEDCELVFLAKHSDTDYHTEMNSKVFLEWFQEKLLPGLKQKSVIILDNASYHNTKTEDSRCPNMSTRKDQMQAWLTNRQIPFLAKSTKPILYELIKRNKPHPVYETDKLAEQKGHVVLRTPPRLCELNAIELIWARVKYHIADKNTTFKLKDVQALVQEALQLVTPEMWAAAIGHTEEIEQKYRKVDCVLEEIAPVIIHLDSDESDSEESDTNTDTDSADSE